MKTIHATNPPRRGDDVAAIQRLLDGAGYRLAVDGVAGPAFFAAVVDAKRRLGYEAAERKPIAGDHFVKELKAARKPLVRPPAKKNKRARVVAYCRWAIEHEGAIHYAQARPMPPNPRALPMSTDCSGFATLAYRDAGARDPNGAKYDGTGYTGTLSQRGRAVTIAQARPADLVFFGSWPFVHVCIVLEGGADPVLASHGQELGPAAIRFSAEHAYHAQHGHPGFQVRSYLP